MTLEIFVTSPWFVSTLRPALPCPAGTRRASLNETAGPALPLFLLGSLATSEIPGAAPRIFGDRLLFPSEFVGRGDMSRGGLMLRCAHRGEELTYAPAHSSVGMARVRRSCPKWKP